jgi:hypothetical protein
MVVIMNMESPVESLGQLPVLMGGMLESRKKQLSRSIPVSPIARIWPAPWRVAYTIAVLPSMRAGGGWADPDALNGRDV